MLRCKCTSRADSLGRGKTAYTSDKEPALVSKLPHTEPLSDVHLSKHHEDSGGDALRRHTRSHPEHEGKDLSGRWYSAGDGAGE